MKTARQHPEASPVIDPGAAGGRGEDISRRWVLVLGWFSLLWLGAILPFLSLYRGGVQPLFTPGIGNQDIANYYMAGALAADGSLDDLYPVPRADLRHNAGWPESSTLKPGYKAVMLARGVEDNHRFILPPPAALLFIPLSLWPYPLARWLWMCGMGGCLWGLCLLGYRLVRRVGGTRLAGLAWWALWAFSPLFVKSLRTGNATPLAALAFAGAAQALCRNRTGMAVAGSILAALLKGSSLVLVPVVLLLKRWWVALLGITVSALLLLVTFGLGGVAIFREFFVDIYPTTRVADPYIANQSFGGFLARLAASIPMLDSPERWSAVTALAVGAAVLLSVWFRRQTLRASPAACLAAVTLLLAWYLVFSPYCWDHYLLHYIPFWGVLWCGSSRSGRGVLAAATLLLWMPLGTLREGALLSGIFWPSHLLWGQLLVLFTAWGNLWGTVPTAPGDRSAPGAQGPPAGHTVPASQRKPVA